MFFNSSIDWIATLTFKNKLIEIVDENPDLKVFEKSIYEINN